MQSHTRRVSAVHPHAGGEDIRINVSDWAGSGSSPRGWGGRHDPAPLDHPRRFIPTRVGRTSKSGTRFPGIAVHPHAGGEDSLSWFWMASFCGSSPRGWGGLVLRGVGHGMSRFIPTRVGRTLHIGPSVS